MKSFPQYMVNEVPQIQPSACVFMDILGYSTRVMDSFSSGLGQQQLEKLFEVMKENRTYFTPNRNSIPPSPWDVKVFSDNIFIGNILHTENYEVEVGYMLTDIADYQLSMVLNGYFVRGGATVGPLHISDDLIFGKALIDAHDLESKKSIYPRVIIAKEMMDIIIENITTYRPYSRALQANLVLVAPDGYPFINYLDSIFQKDDSLHLPFLRKHKYLIEEMLAIHHTDMKVFHKYVWIANYHNYFLDINKWRLGYDKGLYISTTRVNGFKKVLEENNTFTSITYGQLPMSKVEKNKFNTPLTVGVIGLGALLLFLAVKK